MRSNKPPRFRLASAKSLDCRSAGTFCSVYRSRQAGFSLMEVVISLFLLATLMAGALVAYGRATRQSAVSQAKLEVVEIADQLLSQWMFVDEVVPVNETGRCGDQDQYQWKTTSVRVSDQLAKVKLEIYAPWLKLERPLTTVWVVIDGEDRS